MHLVAELRLSFLTIQCFHTFAVWKHFLIYPSPSRGRTCLTRNSSFSSANLPPTSPWRKSKHYACVIGQTSSFVPFVRQRLPRPTWQAASHADFASVRLRHHRHWLPQIILSISNKNKDIRQSTTHGSRLPGRAVLQLHLTPPTSSLHGTLSPTPTVTVASISASLPSSSPSSASGNIRYQASSTSWTAYV